MSTSRSPRSSGTTRRSAESARSRKGGAVAGAAPPLPRELAHLGALHRGDRLHIVLRDGCEQREVARPVPGHGYLLTNGATVLAGTAIFYHLPNRCPEQEPHAPVRHETARDFKVPSSTHASVEYTVHVSETGMLVCNCGAGSYGRPCKHKRQVAQLLARQTHAA